MIKKISIYFILLMITMYGCSSSIEKKYNVKKKNVFNSILVIKIMDEKQTEVVDADIYINDSHKKRTDFDGLGIIEISNGNYKIIVSKKGYISKKINIQLKKDQLIVIKIESFDYYYCKFNNLLFQKKYDEAKKLYNNKIFDANIESEIKSFLYIKLLVLQKEYDQALNSLDELYAIYRDNIYLLSKAKVYSKMDSYINEINIYKRLIKINKLKYYYLYKDIGLIYYNRLNNKVKALFNFRMYLDYAYDKEIMKLVDVIKGRYNE